MPPTQQASKVNNHMMFTPHQNPFIDFLLTTVTVIRATFRKRQQEALSLGADRRVTVGELGLFFIILFNKAVEYDLDHADSKDYNQLKAFASYCELCTWTSMAASRKFYTDWKMLIKRIKKSLFKTANVTLR